MPTFIKCYAVDDEPLALDTVCEFIDQTPYLQLTGRYRSALQVLRALAAPTEPAVDLIFLDIQMPQLSGLDLARVLDHRPDEVKPRVIFTTGASQFALEGHRVAALDFLVKPFNYEDFARASLRAKAYFDLTRRAAPPIALVPTEPVASLPADHVYLKVGYQLVRVDFADLLYAEGFDDHVKVHRRSAARPLLAHITLKALEEKLPAQLFQRVHRSYIVALGHLLSLTRTSVQIGEQWVPVSERYRPALEQVLNGR
jgi:DNA-binding LytR/AlgR family response regulator